LMKTITLCLSLVLVGFAASFAAYGQMNSGAFARSPDHPSTWVVGASNIHQDVRWDKTHQMMVADVTYSTRDWADSAHPTEESEYTLSFPSVRMDRSSGSLVAGRTQVGKISHGLFGNDVVLSRNVELEVHRQHGKIFAAMVPKAIR
jgi:hypothetical protein